MDQGAWTRLFENKSRNLKDSWRLELEEELVLQHGWKNCIVSTGGRFRCSDCGRGWSSNMVRVVCHMRLSNGQGVAKVRPSRQKCKNCDNGPMEKPSIDSENIKILLGNLVEKIRMKCYNENLGRKRQDFRSFDGKRPHEPALCEACHQGICPKKFF
ncbi:receptor-transporting protein 2-like [Centropristis striata]|uniref:receptor-transporting protein 2-like n=1 Tax=Centropristis striata TaxID=184440 RepID=UPI0027E19F94|nr:receptor-transporting protein 2-like [Centropristis striata]